MAESVCFSFRDDHRPSVIGDVKCHRVQTNGQLTRCLPDFRVAADTPMAYALTTLSVFTFIESAAFERFRSIYLDDDQYADLQQFMVANPEAGALVRKSGGVRKLRWRAHSKGKRGGLRVIYYVRYDPDEFWMLTIYSKSQVDDVPGYILRQLIEVFRDG